MGEDKPEQDGLPIKFACEGAGLVPAPSFTSRGLEGST